MNSESEAPESPEVEAEVEDLEATEEQDEDVAGGRLSGNNTWTGTVNL